MRYFAVAFIRTNKKHHVARSLCTKLGRARGMAKETNRVRKGCRRPRDMSAREDGEEEQDGARSPSAAPFPPSWGKSHASRFYECFPPAPGPTVDPREGLPSRIPFPSEQLEARCFFLPFTSSRRRPSSPSFGRPARLPREFAPVDPFVLLSGLYRRYPRMFKMSFSNLSSTFIANSMGAMWTHFPCSWMRVIIFRGY